MLALPRQANCSGAFRDPRIPPHPPLHPEQIANLRRPGNPLRMQPIGPCPHASPGWSFPGGVRRACGPPSCPNPTGPREAPSHTRNGNHVQALAQLEKTDPSVAKAYRGPDPTPWEGMTRYLLLEETAPGRAVDKDGPAEILQERGEFDEAIRVLEPYQGQSLRVDYTFRTLREGPEESSCHTRPAGISTGPKTTPRASSTSRRPSKTRGISLEVVEELTTMQDMIGKKQQGRQLTAAGIWPSPC